MEWPFFMDSLRSNKSNGKFGTTKKYNVMRVLICKEYGFCKGWKRMSFEDAQKFEKFSKKYKGDPYNFEDPKNTKAPLCFWGLQNYPPPPAKILLRYFASTKKRSKTCRIVGKRSKT
jgi:hypothetical protein